MNKLTYIIVFVFSVNLYSQTITVDNTTNSPAQLVNLLLGNSCVEVNNISISSPQSVAYFNKNGSTFPINEGIIIRSGIATHTQGPYTGTNLDSQINTNSDAFLQQLSVANGQNLPITDVAFLEFDFVPLSNSFSFNFLFASNEYGAEQCAFSDVFAFVLTNLDTGAETNLALIPGSVTPVSVNTIRDSAYNQGGDNCSSNNPAFFGSYNVGNPSAVMNMRGNTIVMNASSAVVPNTNYKIRLVIGDYNDYKFDSAVFIQAGSFNTSLDLGDDRVICSGDEFEVVTNLDTSFTFTWYKNDIVIAGETSSNYIVTSPGVYKVEATRGNCLITDTIIFTPLLVQTPTNLQTCNLRTPEHIFNLTTNNEAFLGIDDAIYDIVYYSSLANIISNTPIPNPTNYASVGAETIYIKIFNTQTTNFCDAVYSFDLIVEPLITAGTPGTTNICTNAIGSDYSFNSFNNVVLNGYNSSEYSISYHQTEADAIAGTNAISSFVIPVTPASLTFYMRLYKNNNIDCYGVSSMIINIFEKPLVDILDNAIECSQYVLPPIANGNYFTGPDGTGTPLFAGDIIEDGGTYYIFNGPDANGCTNESSFDVLLIDEYDPIKDYCGTFTVPVPPGGVGAFYTASGGPNGLGTLVATGTQFVNNGTTTITENLYYYAEIEGVFCRDDLFVFYIHPIPEVDELPDFIGCDFFVLPTLTNGTYLFGSTTLAAGTIIAVNGPYYQDLPNFQNTYTIQNLAPNVQSSGESGSCSKTSDFVISLVDTSRFTTIYGCSNEGVVLPPISFGGYYIQPLGQGNSIDPNVPITTSQTIYYYANTTISPNCTDNSNINVIVHPSPLVDQIPSDTRCGEFTLPVLTNGTYYRLSGGPDVADQQQLFAGEKIDLTTLNLSPGTYYVYNESFTTNPDGSITHCTNEHSFTIDIIPNPPTDGISDLDECLPYTISPATNGTIYTAPGGPNGTGTAITTPTTYTSNETFYIYNVNSVNGCEVDIPFTRNFIGVNLPDYQDELKCEFDNYQLPALTHLPPSPDNYIIGYFYQPNGVDPVPTGTVFNTPNTTTTIYVYAENGDRIRCTQEDSFNVIISETPDLATLGLIFDTEECGTYVLPTLPTTTYNINYYSQPGGNAVDLITDLSIENTTNASVSYTYYVHASAIGNPNCNDEISFTFTINPLLDITIDGGIICVDAEDGTVYRPIWLSSGLNPAEFTVNWYLNGTLMGTGPNYIAAQAGTYDVEFTKLTPDLGTYCNYNNTTVTVIESNPAVANFIVSSAFDSNTFITVNLTGGAGVYQYQLNYSNGDFSELQTSNVFSNLATGEYFVTIYDTFGECNPTRVGPIYIINYPKFFTPNGDGYNDNWNIWDLRFQPDAIISIFDRYGKFLKQISPASAGWNGMYNGKQLPSTDYWFTVDYLPQNAQSRQLFKAHFSMKR